MANNGEPQKYSLVENEDGLFYAERNRFVDKEHLAAFLRQETAERISKRYPGSTISENYGYSFWFKSFADCKEPDAQAYLESALKLAVLEIPKSDIEAIVRGVLDQTPETQSLMSSNHDNNFEVIHSLPGTLKELADRITKLEEKVGAGIRQ